MSGEGSLARQLLGWQMVIVCALLGAVAVFGAVQAGAAFRDTEGRRMLSIAEDVAATAGVRAALADPLRYHQLPAFAESARSLSGASAVRIALPDLRVLTTPDPMQLGTRMPVGDSTVTAGRSWVGEVGDEVVAHVPVIGDNGRVIGVVAAAVDRPGFFAGIVHSAGDALVLLGVATLLGVVGSALLARRVKRQTLGLEPREIVGLVEHREAMLHGINEGVVGLDRQNRVTLVNDHARELLSVPADAVGRPVDELGFDERMVDVLTGRSTGRDQIALRGGRVLVMNRMPISGRDGPVGSVVTLRDRTEIVELRGELDANRHTTDTLRAQAHEFSNLLHTIAGLIELGEYEEVRRYVDRVSHRRDAWQSEVGAHVADPAVAALLVAKSSLAAEQGVGLRLAPSAYLGEVDERMSADLVTVLGNLVDNALEALRGQGGWIEVTLSHDEDGVRLAVRDSGAGVAPELADEVFRHGFSTKAAARGGRGLGLALARQACLRRDGSIAVSGAEFTAHLPLEVPT